MNSGRVDATAEQLPELSDERVDEIEAAVFGRIAEGRQRSGRTRRRGWMIGASAAAALVLVVAVAPVAGTFVQIGSAGGSSAVQGAPAPQAAQDSAKSDAFGGGAAEIAPVQAEDREIITTASATVRVDDVGGALDIIGAAAADSGGYVESMSVDGTPVTPLSVDGSYSPPVSGGGYITVRVPADDLQAVVDSLDAVGDVEASGVSRVDVTSQSIDLQARIDAAQVSVDRLTQLMTQAGTVADLIAAESALAERQATLESYQQQLKALDEQVSLSTLTVSVLPRADTVIADPAGFGDGLAAGWNGLVATLNGIVIGIGFLLPWIAIAAVTVLIVWAVVRLVRRRRGPRPDATA